MSTFSRLRQFFERAYSLKPPTLHVRAVKRPLYGTVSYSNTVILVRVLPCVRIVYMLRRPRFNYYLHVDTAIYALASTDILAFLVQTTQHNKGKRK